MRMMMLALVALATSVPSIARGDGASMAFDGTKFSFELVRSAGRAPVQLGSGVMTGEGEGYRLLFDSKGGRFFGYTVKATPLAEGRFRLELGALLPETIARIVQKHEERFEQKLVGASFAIEYPPAQEVGDGEPLLLELMANTETGEKLSDVIRVSATKTEPREAWRLAISKGTVTINGEPLKESGGAAGRYVWFGIKGRGRFVVSLLPVPGYGFVRAELIANRTIRFVAGADTIEWTSADPISSGSPAPSEVWVWHDTEASVHSFGVGAMARLSAR